MNSTRLKRRADQSSSIATWRTLSKDVRLERALPFNPDRALPSYIGGSRAAPPEDCAGSLVNLPLEALNLMAEAVRKTP
jgi:hypothetical protein